MDLEGFAKFRTVDEIRAANKAAGQHWFDKDTMGFFNTRILDSMVWGGHYFISSEKEREDDPRSYTIRMARMGGQIENIGRFRQFTTTKDAKEALSMVRTAEERGFWLGYDIDGRAWVEDQFGERHQVDDDDLVGRLWDIVLADNEKRQGH